MPFQAFVGHSDRLTQRQDALVIADVILFVVGLRVLAAEEVSRRQLLLVARNDQLRATIDGSQCVPGKYLGCLVKDDQIKTNFIAIQKRTYRQRAHHHAWFQPLQNRRDFSKEATERFMLSFLGDLFLQDSEFAGIGTRKAA